QQRPVAEPQEARFSPRKGERARAGQEPADEDHRSEDVQEEREVPAAGSDDGEDAHAPGLKIMSRRMSNTAVEARAWRTTPADVRLRASNSELGPVCPAASSSFAFVIPLVYSTPLRCPTAAAIAHSTSAAMIQPSQMA